LLVLRDGAALILVHPQITAGPARATDRRLCGAVIVCRCRASSWFPGPTV
jgi:hypothetical protein